jgi:hypothetical protein
LLFRYLTGQRLSSEEDDRLAVWLWRSAWFAAGFVAAGIVIAGVLLV